MSIDSTATAAAPLRWKSRPVASQTGATRIATGVSPIGTGVVQAGHASNASGQTAIAGGWNKMRIDTYVTPAQATSPADPFSDPFGDRHATRAAATLVLQPPNVPNPAAPNYNPSNPAQNPNAANPPRGPEVMPAPMPAPFRPMPFNPAPAPAPAPAFPNNESTLPPFNPNPPIPAPLNPTPMPAPVEPMPATPTPTPMNPDAAPSPPRELNPDLNDPRPGVAEPSRINPNPAPSTDLPCPERTYNDQNCCTSDVTCRAFVASLMRDKLSNISLDITPRFQPDKDDAEDNELREKQMSLTGLRDWHRRGVVFEKRSENTPLLRGTLQNLTNGRAIIVDEAGTTQTVPLNDLSEDDLCFISGWWGLPAECAIVSNRRVDLVSRGWTPSTISWTASALCHKPLYFEQVQHERYGHTAGPFKQPFIDGAHFFGSAIMLPYSMALDPPWECEYTLGYYRPGSCAPWQIPPFPFSPRAALSQAGFVVGGIYIIP